MKLKEFFDFVKYLCVPGDRIKPRLNDDVMGVTIHAALGIASEAGETCDAVKKYVAYGREIDRVNMLEELGDLMHFICMMCYAQGLDPEQVIMSNVNKLKTRYPDGFSENSALNRSVENERAGLERDSGDEPR